MKVPEYLTDISHLIEELEFFLEDEIKHGGCPEGREAHVEGWRRGFRDCIDAITALTGKRAK